MVYRLKTTRRFEKDVKRCVKRGLPIEKLREVMKILERDGKLPKQYCPHVLKGDRKGQWECHIEPDWLMIWKQNDDEMLLLMLNTGSHSDIFKK